MTAAESDRTETNLDMLEWLAAYEHGGAELRKAVEGITPEQLRLRPVPGKWSTLEVVCHVADCEQFYADRMKRTVAMDRPLLMGTDGSVYPHALQYHEHDLEEELDLVTLTRRQMARILRVVSPSTWERTAVHSEAGLMTLRDLLLNAVNHLRHHLRTIEEKREAMDA